MEKRRIGVTVLIMPVILFLVLLFPVKTQAVQTGQETETTLIGSDVGRYQLNFTGNTNHYANWNTDGTYYYGQNYIYNDPELGGGYMDSSSACLNLAAKENRIARAFLVWETREPYRGDESRIGFILPNGERMFIKAEYAYNDWRDSGNGSWATATMYCMATDVTELVQRAGEGRYSVCNIPRWDARDHIVNGINPGGESPGSWQLIVIEEGDSFPVRAVTLSMGAKFYMAKDYSGSLFLMDGLKSKTAGLTTGQIFFGASNSSLMAMTENVTSFRGDGGIVRQVESNTTYSSGLYRNGQMFNDRKACIRMSLSDVSDIGNDAQGIRLDVKNTGWTTFFFLGLATDIAFPDFYASQTTNVESASKVTVSGTVNNVSANPNTGIYEGQLAVNLDDALTPVSATATVNGSTVIGGSISGNTVTFGGDALRSMMKGESIQYTIQCSTSNSGKTRFDNSDNFSGRLRSDGVNTGYWIDKACTSSSYGVPKYTLTLNRGNGISYVSGSGDYVCGSWAVVSAAVKPGYHWTAWSGGYTTAQQSFSFQMPAKNLTLTANGEANSYRISFQGNGADSGSMTAMNCQYDREHTLTGNRYGKTGYHFNGWNTRADGGGTSYQDSQKVKNLVQANGGTITLYAQWKANTYTVRFDGNSAETGSMEDMRCQYDWEYTLTGNQFLKTGYHFTGWNSSADGTGSGYTDGQRIQNLVKEQNGVLTLYAQWEANTYTIAFHPNEGGMAAYLDAVATQYDSDVALPDGAAYYQKYTLDGVNVTDAVLAGTLALQEPEGETETEVSETEAPEEEVPEEEPETERTAAPKVYPSVFMGWSLEEGKERFIPQWKTGDVVRNLTAEENATVTLYAVWDDCPWIVAEDLYYTLEQAQSGYITEQLILDTATASDREDGSPIVPGFHADGTSFSIPDYQESDFTQFQHEGSVTENLTVIDSVGSRYRKQITVHVVDTTPVVQKPEGTTRFINEKYFQEAYENGGLEDNSIWKTDPEYRAALLEAFDNLKHDTPEETYVFTHEDILEMKEFIWENGIGNTKSDDALTRFYQRFMAGK